MNADPEEMVIGACMLTPQSVRFASDILEPRDFRSPNHELIFKAIVWLTKSREPVEPFSVWKKSEELGVKGLELAYFFKLMETVGSAASITFYADQVKEASARRQLRMVAQVLLQESSDESRQPSQTAQSAAEAIRALQANSTSGMVAKSLAEILAIEEDHDWVIPGLLEKGDRVLITGFEGGGKTTWIRQMSICMSAGIHPTTLDLLPAPVKVLVIDAENTESQWRAQVRKMTATAKAYGIIDPAPGMHIHANGRIDITKDATLGAIHRLVDEHQPDVLAIGPIYKMVSTGINNDQEAAPLIMALDSLRDRGLALIMEGHASKGSSQNAHRDLAPRGSAALMGWPEFGFGIHPDQSDPSKSMLTRWRGDRDQDRDWPSELMKSGPFPWTGDTVSPVNRRKAYGWNAA